MYVRDFLIKEIPSVVQYMQSINVSFPDLDFSSRAIRLLIIYTAYIVQLLSNYCSRLIQLSFVPIYDNTILHVTTHTNEYGCLRPSGWNPARRICLCVSFWNGGQIFSDAFFYYSFTLQNVLEWSANRRLQDDELKPRFLFETESSRGEGPRRQK